MLYNFIPQVGKKKIVCVGKLSVDKGDAYFWDQDDRCVGDIKRAEVVFIGPHGIMLRGFEPCGVDRTGRQKFKYIEWYCSYYEEKK